jgi:hypothetical protein
MIFFVMTGIILILIRIILVTYLTYLTYLDGMIPKNSPRAPVQPSTHNEFTMVDLNIYQHSLWLLLLFKQPTNGAPSLQELQSRIDASPKNQDEAVVAMEARPFAPRPAAVSFGKFSGRMGMGE